MSERGKGNNVKEILGNNLKVFFDSIDSEYNEAEITYAGNRYEVWEISDDLFKKICDMSEDEFVKLAGDDAWWRSCDGSVLGVPDVKYKINGKEMIGWDTEREWEHCRYNNLIEYLCIGMRASTEKNVCACATDLAKYNNMTMGQLFREYEG